MKRVKSIIVAIMAFSALALTATIHAQNTENAHGDTAIQMHLRGAILPHHNIVGEYIDEFYSEIANPNVKRVILVSTNHFNTGYHYIQASDHFDNEILIDTELIHELEKANVLGVNGAALQGEHGLSVHTQRIKQYFPQARIVPIAIKWQTPKKNLDKLVQELQSKNLKNTIIIASIDFSHYVSEEGAMRNDKRTIAWLKGWEDGTKETDKLDQFWLLEKSTQFDTENSTALDSPESLYILTNLLPNPQKVEIWKRTSSASLFNLKDPMQNTSHIFVKVLSH